MKLAEPTSDILERICDAHWNGSGEGVKFLNIHTHNACNHTLTGTIEYEGEVYGFEIDNGDWGGTVVNQWGDPDDIASYKPPVVEPRTFVPINDNLRTEKPEMYKIYLLWRKEPWFKEVEGKYNYDRHFQPGGFIENHYREWAAKRGMKPGYFREPATA